MIIIHIEYVDRWTLVEMDERQVRVDMVVMRLLLNIGLLPGCKGSLSWSAVLVSDKHHIVALLHGHKVVTLCREAAPSLRR